MKVRLNSTVALTLVAVAVAVFEVIRSGGNFRVPAFILIVIALLLGARYAARRQAQRRDEMLKAVPKHPLGISDEPSDGARDSQK